MLVCVRACVALCARDVLVRISVGNPKDVSQFLMQRARAAHASSHASSHASPSPYGKPATTPVRTRAGASSRSISSRAGAGAGASGGAHKENLKPNFNTPVTYKLART